MPLCQGYVSKHDDVYIISFVQLSCHGNLCVFFQAQLRQKDREIKRLEFNLRSEQHLRCDLEMDLKEKCSLLEQKGIYRKINTIKDT